MQLSRESGSMLEIDFSTKLANLFTAHRDRAWYFVASGGNWGDSLIYAGAERLARSLGLRWTDLDYRNIDSAPPPRGACIYLHGGGGLNSWCTGRAFSNLRSALRVPDALVVQGPQTCDTASNEVRELFASALAESVSREIHFFAREMTSAHLMAEILPPSFHLYVDHDTAFALEEKDVLAIAGVRTMPAGNYDLVVIREDNEQPATKVNGIRPSGIALDPAYVATSFDHWVRMHVFARSISTDRLHSSIIGAICGKPVTLGPSSSHKNKSVWEYSLASRGVRWVEGIEAPDALWWNLLPTRVQNSYKVRRLRLAFHRVPIR
jgi:exopolysaccharide biosynthesis predicted pyruvyltransferase EpsI